MIVPFLSDPGCRLKSLDADIGVKCRNDPFPRHSIYWRSRQQLCILRLLRWKWIPGFFFRGFSRPMQQNQRDLLRSGFYRLLLDRWGECFSKVTLVSSHEPFHSHFILNQVCDCFVPCILQHEYFEQSTPISSSTRSWRSARKSFKARAQSGWRVFPLIASLIFYLSIEFVLTLRRLYWGGAQSNISMRSYGDEGWNTNVNISGTWIKN
jgi:hypothetical protein